jgi:hypothetical protein
MGVGRDDRKPVPIGSAHQCSFIPDYLGASSSFSGGEKTTCDDERWCLISPNVVELGMAERVCKRLSRFAYAPAPANPRYFHQTDDESSDMRTLEPLFEEGVIFGGGRSSYVPGRELLAYKRSAPGMLACEVKPVRSSNLGSSRAANGAAPPPKPPSAAKAPRTATVARTRENQLAALVAYIVELGGDSALVDGWTVTIEERTGGATAGTTDAYFYSPTGKKFRSRAEIARHLGFTIAPRVKKLKPS